jgi:hypothetical protein
MTPEAERALVRYARSYRGRKFLRTTSRLTRQIHRELWKRFIWAIFLGNDAFR